ncbi:MAG: InlB B-repeat-containing protein [Ruminococcus sp.]|nr:InlB B-repeat-containing protein [Ruminococcus sp.]MCM1480006.1 InlB B-repeat-containing protein [Muribaculaceae bacterium]
MKDFLKNFKIPLILGGCALIAVVATLIIVTGGFGGGYGLYITGAYGSVSVTSADVSEAAASGAALKEGDVVTIGEDSYCSIAYQGKKNSPNNSFILGENSQIVISNAFDGKKDGELFLRCGTLIGSFNEDDKSSINVRTADSMITLEKSVAKISYYTNEFMSYTDIYTIMGQNYIQLYDSAGNPVNEAEPQSFARWNQPAWGRVIVSDDGPLFDSLNLKLSINDLSVFDLKQFLTISALIGEDFPYTAEEMRAVYEEKGGDELTAPPVTDAPTEVTEPTETSVSVQTAEPIETTPPPTETTLPGQTTARPWSQTQQQQQTTSAPPVTTVPTETAPTENTSENTDLLPPDDDIPNDSVHYVTVIINGDETIQEVAHGENAVKPADPVIEGLTFVGWDGSFENITQDIVITAIFQQGGGTGTTHTVTVVINGRSNTIAVEHGQSANLPSDVNVEGYVFKGWDKDFSSITQDVTITAILEPINQAHIVTFIINGQSYPVQVEHGGTAVPPYIPDNSTGFIGWDKTLTNITADTTVTAVFAAAASHTVTFMIDGRSYAVTVEDGATVEPPFQPTTDSSGTLYFRGWDKELSNIKSDTIITAIFA